MDWTIGIDPNRPNAAVVLTPELLARVSGFPADFYTFRLHQTCRWALGFGNYVPPPVQAYVMALVTRVAQFAGDGTARGIYCHATYTLKRNNHAAYT